MLAVMTLRPDRRGDVATVLLLTAAAVLAAGLGSGPAAAATGGRWTQLSGGAGVGVSNAPAVARLGRSLVRSELFGVGPLHGVGTAPVDDLVEN